MFKKIILISTILLPFTVHAEQQESSKWSGEAELGFIKSTGNTETESTHAKGKLVNERVKWKYTATIEITNTKDTGVETVNRSYLTGKSDFNINSSSYLFIGITYERNKFSGYDNQTTETVGYGYHVIKNEDLELDLEAGAGARQSKLVTGMTTSETLVKGAMDLEWKISKTATFTQIFLVESGEDSTISRSISGLKMQINGNLSSKITYSIKQSSTVPVGTKKTDSESVVTLVYGF